MKTKVIGVVKSHSEKAEKAREVTFALSTEDEDRDGDIIRVDGWQVDNFMKNPVLLAFHDRHSFPVGTFVKVWSEGKQFLGTARFADKGTSPVADLAYDLVQQDILRAVSVSFTGIEFKFIDDGYGREFTKQELEEVSLVAVPANQNALVVAKGYDEASREAVIVPDYRTADDDMLLSLAKSGDVTAREAFAARYPFLVTDGPVTDTVKTAVDEAFAILDRKVVKLISDIDRAITPEKAEPEPELDEENPKAEPEDEEPEEADDPDEITDEEAEAAIAILDNLRG